MKHGKVHNYLGMTLDFLSPKKMRILMLDYILKLLDDLPEEYGGEVATPAVNHLLEVNDDAKKFSEEEAQFFHHNVAKFIFLCKRARPDLQTSIEKHLMWMTRRS